METPLPPETAVTSQLGRSAAESTPSPPEQPPAGRQLLRYVTTWVNVREGRSRRSPVAFILEPGEAVLVDSLIRGWYRVVVDGEILGYAARPYFDASPPSP
jgi:hypothetical protein